MLAFFDSVFMLQDAGSNSALGALISVQEVVTPDIDPTLKHAQVLSKVCRVGTGCKACDFMESLQSVIGLTGG